MAAIETNKTTVRKFIGLLGTDDITGVQNLMADDLQWIVPQDPAFSALAGSRNKSQWTELYKGFKASVQADVTYTITGLTAEGDRVAAEVEGSADTPAGPFHNRYHFLFELRGGRSSSRRNTPTVSTCTCSRSGWKTRDRPSVAVESSGPAQLCRGRRGCSCWRGKSVWQSVVRRNGTSDKFGAPEETQRAIRLSIDFVSLFLLASSMSVA